MSKGIFYRTEGDKRNHRINHDTRVTKPRTHDATTFWNQCRETLASWIDRSKATIALSAMMLFSPFGLANADTTISQEDALTFAYIADFGSGITCSNLTYNDCRINASVYGSGPTPMQATSLLIDRIRAALLERSLTKWSTVWGPTMQWNKGYAPGKTSGNQYYSTAGTMVVFKKGSTYVVAIAGTNPVSSFGWMVEDFDVTQQVDWPNGTPNSQITAGTAIGLNVLLTMGGGQSAGTNTTLLDYLRSEATATTGPINVVVVGHSLGGTLSPVVATTLIDSKINNLNLKWQINTPDTHIDLQLKPWDPNNIANVSTIFFAGATPGNSNFANYAHSIMPSTDDLISVWGKNDVVPHGWNALGSTKSTGMDNIQNIYTVNNEFCNQPSSQNNCPFTATTPPSSNLDNVICPCLDTDALIEVAQGVAEYTFSDATPVGVGSQRVEIVQAIGHQAAWTACPGSKSLQDNGTIDRMMLEAVYQHGCSYPYNYPSTVDLANQLHTIRLNYAQVPN